MGGQRGLGYRNPKDFIILIGVLLLIFFIADTFLHGVGIGIAYALGLYKGSNSKKEKEGKSNG